MTLDGLLLAVLLPPVVPFATGHFWLFLLTCALVFTVIGWPVASMIALFLATTEGDSGL